jgi:hypothetical protein
MRTYWLRVSTAFLIAFFTLAALQSQENQDVQIQAPVPGEALQGQILIVGTTSVDGFQSAELAFAYAENPTDTWFQIGQSDEPIVDGTLSEWDTTTLTDGNYTLRLIVNVQGDVALVVTIPDLRVRNYSPIETSTPAPTGTPTPMQTPARSPTPVPPTGTPLPENAATLTDQSVGESLLRGALIGLALLATFGLYTRLRRGLRR